MLKHQYDSANLLTKTVQENRTLVEINKKLQEALAKIDNDAARTIGAVGTGPPRHKARNSFERQKDRFDIGISSQPGRDRD